MWGRRGVVRIGVCVTWVGSSRPRSGHSKRKTSQGHGPRLGSRLGLPCLLRFGCVVPSFLCDHSLRAIVADVKRLCVVIYDNRASP